MKLFTENLKTLCFAFLLVGMHYSSKAQCSANFTFTYNANGNVAFTSIVSPSLSAGRYWSFGNSQNSSAANPNITYTANGVYTVCLSMWTPSAAPTCSATNCQTINVTNAITPTCQLNAGFSYSQGSNGLVNFTSTSTGTTAGTTYTWDYGDNSANGNGSNSSHTYATNGLYLVKLFAMNAANCVDSAWWNVNVTSYPCTLNASFNVTQNGNGSVTFVSTSTGTNNTTNYMWYSNSNPLVTGNPATTTFFNGTYTITLVAANAAQTPAVCNSSVSQVVVVTSNTCNLNASFTSTQGANGLVNFASTTTGTTANTVWYWDFGDGFNITGGPNQSHTYTNAGNYPVTMNVWESNSTSCADSIVNFVNVNTIPCVANSNFTLTQNFPLNWTATPAYPWNAAWAIWSWGDNTTTFAPNVTTSHTYSQTQLYTICLTISVTCGGTSSTCATYSINRTSSPVAMAYVNVVLPTSTNLSTGVKHQTLVNTNNFLVYPNPSNGKFELSLIGMNEEHAKIKVYDIAGVMIYEANGTIENGNLNHTIKLDKPQGIYFVKIESNSGVITQKIILKD